MNTDSNSRRLLVNQRTADNLDGCLWFIPAEYRDMVPDGLDLTIDRLIPDDVMMLVSNGKIVKLNIKTWQPTEKNDDLKARSGNLNSSR